MSVTSGQNGPGCPHAQRLRCRTPPSARALAATASTADLSPVGTLTHFSDAELLLKAASEPTAFAPVFMRHGSAIERYLRRRVEPAIVEDLVSETFAVAFHERARYRCNYPNARPWLVGIAANLVRHHRRRERAREAAYARANAQVVTAAVATAALARTDSRLVRADLAHAVGKLRPDDRDAFLLMALGELSYEEIARALEIPVGTVRSRINRARRCLHDLLEGSRTSS